MSMKLDCGDSGASLRSSRQLMELFGLQSIEKTLPAITKTARLKELVHFVRVNATTFNHLDFLLGKDADVLVYDPVIKILKRYNFPEFPVHNDSISVSINTV